MKTLLVLALVLFICCCSDARPLPWVYIAQWRTLNKLADKLQQVEMEMQFKEEGDLTEEEKERIRHILANFEDPDLYGPHDYTYPPPTKNPPTKPPRVKYDYDDFKYLLSKLLPLTVQLPTPSPPPYEYLIDPYFHEDYERTLPPDLYDLEYPTLAPRIRADH